MAQSKDVIAQHGLGGDRSFVLETANAFAKRGWATVAIESVTFGASATTAVDATTTFPQEMVVDYVRAYKLKS